MNQPSLRDQVAECATLVCEKADQDEEKCRVLPTFWCEICESHVYFLPDMRHRRATRRTVLMAPNEAHPYCKVHGEFAVPREEIEEKLAECLACGKKYVPSRASQKFCSPACRQRSYRRTMEWVERRMEKTERVCAAPGCSTSITSLRSDARYCSSACRVRAHREGG